MSIFLGMLWCSWQHHPTMPTWTGSSWLPALTLPCERQQHNVVAWNAVPLTALFWFNQGKTLPFWANILHYNLHMQTKNASVRWSAAVYVRTVWALRIGNVLYEGYVFQHCFWALQSWITKITANAPSQDMWQSLNLLPYSNLKVHKNSGN